jgi:hypothetical protein
MNWHSARWFGLGAAFCAAMLARGSAQAASAAPSPDAILRAADIVRFPQQPFKLTNTLVEYINGKAHDSVVLSVYSKPDPATAEFNTLVRYVEPPRDAGKMVLFNGTNLWFYDPASKESVRISPQQRLIGQAADGDVVTTNLSRDYAATMLGAETLQDADRADRDCWHLDLKPKAPGAVYARIEIWIERSSSRPVKAKFYSDSGRMLKIAYYHRYSQVLDAVRPTETIIIDAVDVNLVTTMTTAGFVAQAIPDAWFQRDFLPRVP